MAVKFSQFVVETDKANVNYLVGWDGTENVQITPADLLSGTPTGSGATGQVAFFDSASTLTGDNDLYWDNTNKRLGIGTSTPGNILEVKTPLGAANMVGLFNGTMRLQLGLNNSAGAFMFVQQAYALRLGTGNTERMRVTAAGDVGIGTTTPAAKLHVDGSLIATGISQLGSGGSNVYLTSSSAGNVGIGTSSPVAKLHVYQNNSDDDTTAGVTIEQDGAGDAALSFLLTGTKRWRLGIDNNDSDKFKISDATNLASSNKLTIDVSGDVGIGTTSPISKMHVLDDFNNSSQIALEGNTPDHATIRVENDNTTVGSYASLFLRADTADSRIAAVKASSASNDVDIVFMLDDTSASASVERLRIVGDTGGVGIGTSSPLGKLHVVGDTDVSSHFLVIQDNDPTAGSHRPSIRFRSNTAQIGQIAGLDTGMRFSVGTTEDSFLEIKDTGNVGIGTATPGVKLTVSDSVDNAAELRVLRANSSSSTYASVGTVGGTGLFKGSGDVRLQATGASNLSLNTNGSDRMRINSSGDVGIGTNSPASKLNIETTKTVALSAAADFLTLGLTVDDSTAGNTAGGGGGIAFRSKNTNAGAQVVFGAIDAIKESANVSDFRGSLRFFTNQNSTGVPLERMRIDSSGNVGIGTTSPGRKLEVYNASSAGIKIQSGDANQARLDLVNTDGSFGIITNAGTFRIYDDTDNVERLKINTNGNVGIGTSSPQQRLTVGDGSGSEIISIYAGNTNASAVHFTDTNTSTDYQGFVSYNHSSDALRFGTAEAERMRINSSGYIYVNTNGAEPSASQVGVRITGTQGQAFWNSANSGTTGYNHFNFYNANGAVGSIVTNGSATAFNTSSDYRLKEDLKDFDGLDKVSKIPVYDFKWKVDDSRSYGVLAHELQEVVPNAVNGEKDAEEMQGVDYSKIVPLLIKSIQELEAKVKELKSKI